MGGLLFNKYRASVWEDEKFLEMDGGGGGRTALGMCVMSWNWILSKV